MHDIVKYIKMEKNMSLKNVHDLLEKGATDREFRIKYDNSISKTRFVEKAKAEGFDFTEEELMKVIRENGDDFDSSGNPPKKDIWS